MVKKKSDEDKIKFLPHLFSMLQCFFFPFGLIGIIVTYAIGEGKLREHSKKALNWQISLLIYTLISAILIFILVGFLLLAILWIGNFIVSLIALLKSTEDKLWDYPLSIRFLN